MHYICANIYGMHYKKKVEHYMYFCISSPVYIAPEVVFYLVQI